MVQKTRFIDSVKAGMYRAPDTLVTNAISSSYAATASYAVSASHEIIKEVSSSHADTASFAQSGDGTFNGSFSGSYTGYGGNLTGIITNPFTGSLHISGSITLTGSLNITGSTINNIGPFNQTGESYFIGNITSSGDISSSGLLYTSASEGVAGTDVWTLLYNTGSGQVFYTASSAVGGSSFTAAGISGSWQGVTSSMTVLSASYATTASFAQSGDGIFSGSFSGSYAGYGGDLTGISAGFWTGSSGTITREGDVQITGSLIVSSSGITSIGSITGSEIFINNGTNISPSDTAPGQLRIAGSGYNGYIAMDGTAMYIGHNSTTRDLVFQTDDKDKFTISQAAPYTFTFASDPGTGDGVKISDGNTTIDGDTQISGSLIVSGSSLPLTVLGSGSTVFDVVGSAGILFAVNDGLDGELFAANNISGLPVISAHADNTVRLGKYNGFGIVISGSTPAPNDNDAKILITGSIYHTGSVAEFNSNVHIKGSGSTVFDVIGSVGTLFSVDDDLTGMLFTTNDITGFPILQASASGEVFIGKSPQSLYTTAVISATSASATASVYSLSTSSYDGAFIDYTITSASNARAGTIMSIWKGGTLNYTDTSTTSIGSTSGIEFDMIISQSQAQLVAVTDSTDPNTWKIKTIIRSI